jgi:hypothetical protein
MWSVARGYDKRIGARSRAAAVAASPGVYPRARAGHWRLVQRLLTRALLAIGILALGGLGSYDLEAAKPRAVGVPMERVCSQRFPLSRGSSVGQIPLCLNVASLGVPDPSIQRAIIVVHGSLRDAAGAENAVETVLHEADRTDTLVLAPQFLTPLDLRGRELPADLTIWRSSGWSQGDRSDVGAPADRFSSFEVLDRLIEEIAAPGRYPNLTQITIAGHSAGGQFVQRYAAGSRIEQQPTVVHHHLTFKYVVANPSSYLYLFPREPDRMTQRCPTYDQYKYGLNGLNTYMLALGPDGIRAAYPRKDVTILLGRQDYQILDPSKDDSCEAQAQGAHRENRGIRFVQQLDRSYGPGQHQTRVVLVPGVGHNTRAMLTSPEGRAALLGN